MADTVACSVCGATSPSSAARCVSCGARLSVLPGEGGHVRSSASVSFRWMWVLTSAVAFSGWAGLALVALPAVVPSYDPQGLPGVAIAAAGWLLIALLLATVVPGRTVFEPAVGAMASVIPVILYLRTITDVRAFEIDEQVFGGLLGILCALLGGVLGDRLQQRLRQPSRPD